MTRRQKTLILLASVTIVTFVVQLDRAPNYLNNLVGIDWSAAFVAFLKQNTQGLIVFVLLGLFLEWCDISKDIEESRIKHRTAIALIENTLATSSARSLTEAGLSKAFGSDASRDISNNLFKQSQIIEQFNASIKISANTSHFILDFEFIYISRQSQILIAVTKNPSHSEALLSTGLISEAYFDSSAQPSMPVRVTRIGIDQASGVKIDVDLTFREMSSNNKKNIFLGSGIQFSVDEFAVYEGFPVLSDKLPHTYRFTHQIRQEINQCHTFWMSDRVMQINRIEIDLRDLGKDVFDQAHVYRFMGLSHWSMSSGFPNGKCVIDLKTWVMAGEGIFVTWPHVERVT